MKYIGHLLNFSVENLVNLSAINDDQGV
jgi:hypothetical protein